MINILAIEDNPDNMALIDEILDDEEDYNLLKAIDAEQGIQLLKNYRVGLILMDISLPNMNGLEATKFIKKQSHYSHIPIVVLTALAMETDREAAFRAGCNAFLTKPIDEELLLETIRDLIATCE